MRRGFVSNSVWTVPNFFALGEGVGGRLSRQGCDLLGAQLVGVVGEDCFVAWGGLGRIRDPLSGRIDADQVCDRFAGGVLADHRLAGDVGHDGLAVERELQRVAAVVVLLQVGVLDFVPGGVLRQFFQHVAGDTDALLDEARFHAPAENLGPGGLQLVRVADGDEFLDGRHCHEGSGGLIKFLGGHRRDVFLDLGQLAVGPHGAARVGRHCDDCGDRDHGTDFRQHTFFSYVAQLRAFQGPSKQYLIASSPTRETI